MSQTNLPIVKSRLQQRLEAEGWKYLTNDDPRRILCPRWGERDSLDKSDPERASIDLVHLLWHIPHFTGKAMLEKISSGGFDELLGKDYASSGFKRVLVTNAYDIHGRPIQDMRAVYVWKGNQK